MSHKSLHDVCTLTGATRRAVQGSEKAGLVAAVGRTKYGYLLYDDAAVERIRTIRFLQRTGLSIREICAVIDAPAECQRKALRQQAERLQVQYREISALLEMIEEYLSRL